MMNLNELDERQKNCVYRAGFESFLGLFVLFSIQALLKQFEVSLFTGNMGNFTLLYVGGWYFNVRRAMLDCEMADKNRKTRRKEMTRVSIAGTIFFIFIAATRGWRFVDLDGDVGPGVFICIILASVWIITVIEWIQKNKGYEEYT